MNFADIRGRVCGRLEWDPNNLVARTLAGAAINEGQRIFSFLTLSLEVTRTFPLTAGLSFYSMLAEGWSDWIVPLRLSLAPPIPPSGDALANDPLANDVQPNAPGGSPAPPPSPRPKLAPCSIYEMAAKNSAFLVTDGTPDEYDVIGWDLLIVNRRPISGVQLQITYARSSDAMVADGDIPQIHEADHQILVNYGTWRLRGNEGGQELAAASPLFQEYLDAAKKRADQARARSASQRYDRAPFELEGFDYSRMLKSRPDLAPYRKENRWTGQR